MRLFSFVFFGMLLICSCTAPNKSEPQAAIKYSVVNADSSILRPGLWVNKKYVDAINKDHSPKDAEFVTDRSCIYIPEKAGDITRFVFGFHDGAEDLVLIKNENEYRLKSANGNAQNLKIELLDTNKIKIDADTFIFAGKEENNIILEKFLFKGKYMLGNKTVEFKENGDLTGFPMADRFRPEIDYAGDVNTPDFNEIEFLNNKKTILIMGFKFSNDSLILYKTTGGQYDSVEKYYTKPELGEMIYQLKKVN